MCFTYFWVNVLQSAARGLIGELQTCCTLPVGTLELHCAGVRHFVSNRVPNRVLSEYERSTLIAWCTDLDVGSVAPNRALLFCTYWN